MVQNRLQTVNHFLLKTKGLYLWSSPLRSRQYMAVNAIVFALFAIVPFRVMFSILVLFHFTEHFRSDSGLVDRFISKLCICYHLEILFRIVRYNSIGRTQLEEVMPQDSKLMHFIFCFFNKTVFLRNRSQTVDSLGF